MKISRRIATLMLALLMVLTALPVTTLMATAADVATPAAAGTPGTAPATLPNGKTYAGTTLFGFDAAQSCRDHESGTGAWFSGVGTGVAAMLQDGDGAEGIMFRIDTSAANVTAEEILKMNFAISFSFDTADGTTRSSYIIAAPKQAAGWSGNVTTDATDVSTWYYSQDGATWKSTSENGAGATMVSLPVGKQITYVYIPLSSMWLKEGETFLKTGTNNNTDPALTWVEARDAGLISDNYRFNSVRFLFSGAAWQDANTKVDEWKLVDHVAAVSDMVTKPFLNTNVPEHPAQNWGSSYYLPTANQDLRTAKGIMFEMDTTHVAAGEDNLAITVLLGNYFMSNWKHAADFGAGTKAPDMSSIMYWSEDGVNWTGVETTTQKTIMPKSRAKAYVYIPFESFWGRYPGEDKVLMDFKDLIAAGQNPTSYFCVYYNNEDPANAGVKFSNWNLVLDDSAAKTQLPVVGQTTMSDVFYAGNKPSWTALTGKGFSSEAFANADGVIFKMDLSQVTANPKFTLMLGAATPTGGNGGNNYILATAKQAQDFGNATVPADAVSTWYYSVDGKAWASISADKTTGSPMNWANTSVALSQEVYVYIPMTSFWSRYTANYITGASASSVASEPSLRGDQWLELMNGNLQHVYVHGYYSTTGDPILKDFRFVQFGADRVETSATAPQTYPGSLSTYTVHPMFIKEYDRMTYDVAGQWVGNIFAENAITAFNQADGLMLKVNTEGCALDYAMEQFTFSIAVSGNNDVSTYICANVNQALTYQNTTLVDAESSTWYVSTNGKDWNPITQTGVAVGGAGFSTNVPVTNAVGDTWVYIPKSAMYVRHGATKLAGGADTKADSVLTLAEAEQIVGGWKSLGNFALWSSKRGLVLSDFTLIKNVADVTSLDVFVNESVTVTDDLAYNLYVTIPEGAENVTMTFNFNGKTYTVVGVEQADGRVKYTLSKILPQYMGVQITATWTATVNGESVQATHTTTVAAYVKKLLNRDTLNAWDDMAKALLHYGAAAQTYVGDTSELVNKDVANVIAPVDRTTVPGVYVNGDKSIWTSAALFLRGAIQLKVGVNAPEGITKVQYTVGDRTDVVSIKDGYVYIPVYAYEFMNEITLACYDGTAVTADGTLKISAFYYLSKASSADAKMDALLDAVAIYAAEAVQRKGDAGRMSENTITTLAQLALEETTSAPGMSYVVQLSDGRFIVIDGGCYSAKNAQLLWNYMWTKSNYSKPTVAAWIITHVDGDHTDNAFFMLDSFKQKIDLEMIAYTIPTTTAITGGSDGVKNLVTSANAKLALIKSYYPGIKVWDMKKGDVKSFADVNVQVLMDATTEIEANPFEHNQFSAVLKLTFTQGTAATADDKTFMVLGDSTAPRLEALDALYDDATLKSDVLQAAHHALYGGVKSVYTKIAPKISLMSIWEANLRDDYEGSYWTVDFNAYLLQNSTCYFHDNTVVINMADLSIVK